jgi:hypothetical protein
VTNFIRLYELVFGFGSRYAAIVARLMLDNLRTVRDSAVAAMAALDREMPNYLKALSARDEAFAPLSKLVTRIGFVIDTLHVDKDTAKAIRELIRKLHGERAKAKKDVPQEEHKYISVSQLSFDQRIENFNKLVELLIKEPLYKPTDADLITAHLTDMLAAMRNSNVAAIDAEIPVLNTRNDRNRVLYTPIDGLVDVGNDVKRFIRGSLGPNSDEYNDVKGLEFTKKR